MPPGNIPTPISEHWVKAQSVIPNKVEEPRLRTWVMPGKQRDHSPCERSVALLWMTSSAGLRSTALKVRMSKMRKRTKRGISARRGVIFALIFLAVSDALAEPTARTSPPKLLRSHQGKQGVRQDDSVNAKPASDLALRPGGERKAAPLTHFHEGMAFEENGEMDHALDAYRRELNVDPGQSQLAGRVAGLLIQQDDFPQAIDVLKDAIKANANNAQAYQQREFIHANCRKITDEANHYCNSAIALNPAQLDR